VGPDVDENEVDNVADGNRLHDLPEKPAEVQTVRVTQIAPSRRVIGR